MAGINKNWIKMISLLLSLGFSGVSLGESKQKLVNKRSSTDLGVGVNDAATIDAFRMYWSAFDKFEKKELAKGQIGYKKSLAKLKQFYFEKEKKSNQKQLEKLKRSSQTYQKQLEQHADATNRPYVMLNLAQVKNQIGVLQKALKISSGEESKMDALSILADVRKQFPRFSKREASDYLRATIFESMDQAENALTVWKELASYANSSIYGVHALIAVGDHYFKMERAVSALKRYKKALTLLNKVPTSKRSYEKLRVQYRVAWAAYRSAELGTVLDVGRDLLSPGRYAKNTNQRKMIQKDAVELIGDALFETNDFAKTKSVLRDKKLLSFAPAIGLRVLTRYGSSEIFEEAARVGEFISKEFSLSLHSPQILAQLAIVYQKLNKFSRRIASLEKLALILPKDSLWRGRFKGDYQSISDMEKAATAAAQVVAAWHYDKGLASGNQSYFEVSESFYSILIDADPTSTASEKWRLRRAHGNYFSDHLEKAANYYSELKEDFKISPSTLQIAGYQLVLTREKIWRKVFTSAFDRGDDVKTDQNAIATLDSLEKSIDEFANRFANQSRAVDVMLVGASAFRDQGEYDRAAKMWQRVLMSKPSPAQRSTAIRGIVFAAMKSGSTKDVIQASRRFLKLEDWKSLGNFLGNELSSVLSVAALNEGQRLNQDGRLGEAGKLLVGIAEDFPSIPNRAKIYRDGAYMLALAGEWSLAAEYARNFTNDEKNKKEKSAMGDLVYLAARADEYQIRFSSAAKGYLRLGRDYPGHSRALTSLERAEKLSLAEDHYKDAAQASYLMGVALKNDSRSLAKYKKSIQHYIEAEKFDAAVAVAKARLKKSRKVVDKLESRMLLAHASFLAGSETQALKWYGQVSHTASKSRGSMSEARWSELVGESNFRLGEEARVKFEDFDIAERGGSLRENINIKVKYFSELSKYYGKADGSSSPEWGSKARFFMAESAGDLADEIASLTRRSKKDVTVKSQRRYLSQVKRLREISRKFHNRNVVARSSNPSLYYNNEWVKKSAIRLSGYDLAKDKNSFKENLPSAVNLDLPSQWSL